MFKTSAKIHLIESDAGVVCCLMRLAIHADASVGGDKTMIALEINPMVALNAGSSRLWRRFLDPFTLDYTKRLLVAGVLQLHIGRDEY